MPRATPTLRVLPVRTTSRRPLVPFKRRSRAKRMPVTKVKPRTARRSSIPRISVGMAAIPATASPSTPPATLTSPDRPARSRFRPPPTPPAICDRGWHRPRLCNRAQRRRHSSHLLDLSRGQRRGVRLRHRHRLSRRRLRHGNHRLTDFPTTSGRRAVGPRRIDAFVAVVSADGTGAEILHLPATTRLTLTLDMPSPWTRPATPTSRGLPARSIS